MNSFKKPISIILVIAIIVSATLTGCSGDFGESIRDFFSGLFSIFRRYSVTETVQLPDRPYILETDEGEPEQIGGFLAQPEVTAEDLLLSPALEDQLMSAESLKGIADSKSQVDNLKGIQNELEILQERMESDEEADEDLAGRIDALNEKIDSLLSDDILGPLEFKPMTALMGTWAEPDKVILRWSPQMDWVPDDGYDLYRVLGGETVLLSGGLGTAAKIAQSASLGKEFSEYIKPLFDGSRATLSVLQAAGVSTTEEFNRFIIEKTTPVRSKYRFSGEQDFVRSKDLAFTVKATLAARVPAADISAGNAITLRSEIRTLPLSIAYVKNYGFAPFTKVDPASAPQPAISETVLQVMQSRNDLLTKANVDVEFAAAAGFGYEDNLKGKGIAKSTMIEYVLVPKKPELGNIALADLASGSRPAGTYTAKVEYGVGTPLDAPEGLTGYGADNGVYLRWAVPDDVYARSIISGYYIERKMKRAAKFTVLNEVPVTVSYLNDEHGILYEMPVFYSDLDIANGDSAVYRIRALDLFGRLSGYSEELSVAVYKVTPPNTPNVDQPTLSTENLARNSDLIQESASLNGGKTGIILPITKTSEDTKEFAIFRSQAFGSGSFEDPVEIARIEVKEARNEADTHRVVRYKRVKLVLNPAAAGEVSAVYF
ncbi:MAG: fibronectin type III domain-containing protein, partial [Saccharofermentanales bacterium]